MTQARTMLSTTILLVMVTSLQACRDSVQIYIDTGQPVAHTINNRFLSIAIDSNQIRHKWGNLDFGSRKVQYLASSLNPSYLRLGGTAADLLLFDPYPVEDTGFLPDDFRPTELGQYSERELRQVMAGKKMTNFTMSQYEWTRLNWFTRKVGWDLIFDLNVLLRRGSKWDPDNARELVSFSDRHGFNISWELGNEPNSFRHVFGVNLTASQLGQDFTQLRSLLNRFPRYRDALVVGPDVTRGKPRVYRYIRSFLKRAKGVVGAVTWHHYYFNGRTATLDDFLDPDIFDSLRPQVRGVMTAVRSVDPDAPVWLGETSSAYGGGAPGLSDRFVASFIWMDKLGLSASMGLDLVIRQAFYGSSYSLLDSDCDPLPDYWLSVLHKRLVGRTVLVLSGNFTNCERFYVHCTREDHRTAYTPGSVTVFGMNLNPHPIRIGWVNKWDGPVNQYLLSSNDLCSQDMYLNGQLLRVLPDGSLPDIVPDVIDPEEGIDLPSHTLGFWVIPEANVSACFDNK